MSTTGGVGPASSTQPTPQGTMVNNAQGFGINMSAASINQMFVLLGVQGTRRTLDLAQIDVNNHSDDGVFFSVLREKHKILRGFWRYWFSVWQLNHCDFVKVRQQSKTNAL